MAVESQFEADSRTPTQMLRALGLDARKSLGQHFLHDRNIVRRIVSFAGVESDDIVIEIGPGLGILTRELAAIAERVIAIEKDIELVEALTGRLPANVEVIHGDALSRDPAELVGDRQYKVVANLPYNVATRIIRTILESTHQASSLTLMVQREVAERMTASPPDMSVLGVAVQFYGTPTIGFRVGRGAFTPPPNVESAVIRIDTHEPPLPRSEHERFFALVRTAFQTRRKQLAGSVAAQTSHSKEFVRRILGDIGKPAEARPEELEVDDWVRLFRALDEAR